MSDSNYSLKNCSQFVFNNFGVIFLSLVFLVGGFFVGSVWTENKMMKNGQVVAQQPTQDGAAEADQVADKENNLDQMPELTDQDHIIGSKNPKIYLVEYSDYECPYCQKFSTYMKEIMQDYDDQIARVFRHYPLSFHPNAQPAAQAAECVAADAGNDSFWKYTDEIFNQNEKLGGKLSEEAIQTAIKISGADTDKVNECLKSGKMTDLVSEMQTGGAKAGVSGTPGTILITADGQYEFISGALPVPQLKQIIDKYL